MNENTETPINDTNDTSDISNSEENTSDDKKDKNINYDELVKKDYEYPDPSDPNFQYKIYKKREFYYHKIPERPKLTDYADIKEYRDNICGRQFTLHEHQAMLSNFINPETPYRGLLVFHGLGSGKCVLPDSKIFIVNKNDNIQTEIETLWDKYKTNIIEDEENGIWSVPKENIYVRSFDGKNIVNGKVKRLYKQYIGENIKIIRTKYHTISTTLVHKLLVSESEKIKWENSIKPHDKILVIDKNNKLEEQEVMDVEYKFYEGYVYDLEIEHHHNFVANHILCHNTCASISIAEKFKNMVQKYGTKIYVLVNGPILKENFKKELLQCTGETYLKYQDKSVFIDKTEEAKMKKNALNNALQYYRLMSYRSFYKRVLGEKIIDKKVVSDDGGDKVKVSYRKTDEGEFERDIAVDRIYNLNNSVIIVDEAHNLTGNAYGEALKHIIDNSFNLRVILLTATPMKNLADDIVELLNFIRPKDNPILREKIFTTDKIHLMEIKDGGMEYLKNMARGYVSHVRGADPLTYAKRVDKGIVPEGLLFTKVIRCPMMKFQKAIYEQAVRDIQEDSLDRKSEAVANFAFPALSPDRKALTGYYGREGLNMVKNQLKTSNELLNKKIATDLLKEKEESDFINITDDGKTITGKLMKLRYLKYFSTKFYKAMKKINRLVWGKKGPKTAFVYSNLVKVGIELFQEVLIQNGYLEYQDNPSNYRIKNDTLCYYCGKTYKEHLTNLGNKLDNKEQKGGNKNEDNNDDDDEIERKNVVDSETDDDEEDESEKISLSTITTGDFSESYNRSASSTDYDKYKEHKTTKEVPEHQFNPATFIAITGKSSEESAEYMPEDKQNTIKDVFNKIENKEGKFIKLVLGSKVMNEGVSLKNVSEVHILDVYFNLGKVDQTVGRAIRYCSHYNVMSEANKFPYVNVYRYVISTENGLSTEEELYKKAESKYLLIKKVERSLKEVAIDCPLNTHGNMFKEEIEQYKNCGEQGQDPCPTMCDHTKCEYHCDDLKLNNEFYDPNRNIYKKIAKDKLDTTTFTNALARSEINYSKNKIKDLYLKKYVYTINEILDYVKDTYSEEKRDLFDEFFVYKALDELIPFNENDFNNFKDTVLDKFNRQGYLIYVNKYYIFQPFEQNEDAPMYYRTTYDKEVSQSLSLLNYLKNMKKYNEFIGQKSDEDNASIEQLEGSYYDFNSVMDYYDNRDEYKYVGIIDKELSRRKTKQADELKDVFKIREKRAKVLDKKRGTGIPSIHGAVCATAKSKEYLEGIAKDMNITVKEGEMRTNICDYIKDKLIEMEKYATGKNKITYIMVPANHKTLPFPLNLEDRIKHIENKLRENIKIKFDIKVETKKHSSGNNKGKPYYEIIIKNDGKMKDYDTIITKYGGKLVKNEWIILVE